MSGVSPMGALAGDGSECVICGDEAADVHRGHFGCAVCGDCCRGRCEDSTFGRGDCPGRDR